MPNLTYKSHDDLIASWPTPLKVGLLSSAPNPDGTSLIEPLTGDGYARQTITFDKTQADGVTTLNNSIPVVFGPATTEGWPTVSYFGLFDGNGDLRLYGRLRTARATPVGEATTFPVNDFTLRLR